MVQIHRLFIVITVMAFSLAASASDFVQERISTLKQPIGGAIPIVIEARIQPEAGAETIDRVDFHTEKGTVFLTYSYSEKLLNDPTTLLGDFAFLHHFLQINRYSKSVAQNLELFYNAHHGSAAARHYLLERFLKEIETYTFEDRSLFTPLKKNLTIFNKNISSPSKADVLTLGSAITNNYAKENEKNRKLHLTQFEKSQRVWNQWKKQSKKLDELDRSMQLDELVRNNDRQGVRKLIEAYLPWTMMEPYETLAWKSWLDAIETKASPENSRLVYRGVSYDTDIPFSNSKGEVGFMSTLLTKSEGTFNERLRSLETRRLINGIERNNPLDDPKAPVVTIASQLNNHAGQAYASSFLSFTTSLSTAFEFVADNKAKDRPRQGGLLVVRVANSRAFNNGPAADAFREEREVLMPLIVFPDEVVFYKETSKPDEVFFNEVTKDLKNTLSAEEFKALQKNNKSKPSTNKLAQDYFRSFSSIITKYAPAALNIGKCEKVFDF